MDTTKIDLLCVLGHTAAGKTAFAAQLADRIGSEIISADSRQVYRGMDIGTGKDYEDYQVGDHQVPVHLIDILDAGYEYNVFLFKQDFQRAFSNITERDIMPLLCGGTGMYIESVLRNYKFLHVPANQQLRKDLEQKSYEELIEMLKLYGPLHNTTDTGNRKRTIRAIEIARHQSSNPVISEEGRELHPLVLGIRFERNQRRKRISERLQERLKSGMVEEVEGLLRTGVPSEKLDFYGLEYRYVNSYIQGDLSYDAMTGQLNTAIHQFAKRQMTYFRGMERRGIPIHWLDGEDLMEEKIAKALVLIEATRHST